jgi:hypothetical protein
MAGLNENHKRKIRATLQYADKLLGDSLHVLAPSSRSLFSRYVDDVSPAQYHWVKDYAAKIRRLTNRSHLRVSAVQFRLPAPNIHEWPPRRSLGFCATSTEVLSAGKQAGLVWVFGGRQILSAEGTNRARLFECAAQSRRFWMGFSPSARGRTRRPSPGSTPDARDCGPCCWCRGRTPPQPVWPA